MVQMLIWQNEKRLFNQTASIGLLYGQLISINTSAEHSALSICIKDTYILLFANAMKKNSCLSCSRLNKRLPLTILSFWKHSMGTEYHIHPFNAVFQWCANSHAYYITELLLPGLTPLINPCTLCCTWAIYILHPTRGWSKIPLQSIIHWETFQNRVEKGLRCTGIDQGADNK